MSKLKKKIDATIVITPDGQPYILDVPKLKKALEEIADTIDLMKIQIDHLKITRL
jgi:hypothetical protein